MSLLRVITKGREIIIVGAYGLVYKVQRQEDLKMFALKKMNISGCGSNSLQGWHFMKAYKSEVETLVGSFSEFINYLD
jgi:hypothetical protein